MSTSLINIGIGGLRAQQAALATTGHNITQANTPGYSRQRVELSANAPQFTGAGYLGTGTAVAAVTRVANEFVLNQIRLDTAAFAEIEDYLSQISQVDSLLADETTGLLPALQSFFGSLQAASSDPASIPNRQLVLSEATGLVNRFHTLYERLDTQQRGLAQLISTATDRVNELAVAIGRLNERIASSDGLSAGAVPNDLLDQRDEQLRKLSELVAVRVVPQSDGQVNVFIGKGQPLVLGHQTSALVATDGEIGLNTGGATQIVSSSISGGTIGGLLAFQDGVLASVQNQIGRIALAVADAVNSVHRRGITLDGAFGGDLFTEVNASGLLHQRVTPVNLGDRTPGSMTVAITDTGALTTSDYEIRFDRAGDGGFALVRLSDSQVVAQGSSAQGLPTTVAADGFEVTIESGTFRGGDGYKVQPARAGARDIAQLVHNARDLAFAAPIGLTTGAGNRGTAVAAPEPIFDAGHPAFDASGRLTPPLLVRFTSATTYELLDNSDPTAPRPLDPPVRNQPYVPGVENLLLPSALGTTRVGSNGASVAALPGSGQLVTGVPPVGNRYGPEVVTLTRSDPATGGHVGSDTVTLTANASAREIALRLAAVAGVGASALTEVDVTQLREAGGSVPLTVILNGERFTGSDLSSLDAFADAINARESLMRAGIAASSSGDRLRLTAAFGDDLSLYVSGDVGDGLDLVSLRGDTLALDGSGAGQSAQWVGGVPRPGGYDFSTGGPYTFSLSVDGEGAAPITLDANYPSGAALVAGVQAAIDASAIGPGRLVVTANGAGQVVLTSLASGSHGSITVFGAPQGGAVDTALGFANGTVNGLDLNRAVSVGGSVSVTLEPGLTLTSDAANVGGNVFTQTPPAVRGDLGFQVRMTGRPEAGDVFALDFNRDGVSDNRNVLALAELQTARIFGSGGSLFDAYADAVESVGAATNQARIDRDASEGLLRQSTAQRESLSGVNLDEEAANLIRFEQAYNAAARVIAVARETFDVLFNMVR